MVSRKSYRQLMQSVRHRIKVIRQRKVTRVTYPTTGTTVTYSDGKRLVKYKRLMRSVLQRIIVMRGENFTRVTYPTTGTTVTYRGGKIIVERKAKKKPRIYHHTSRVWYHYSRGPRRYFKKIKVPSYTPEFDTKDEARTRIEFYKTFDPNEDVRILYVEPI